ncbi:MAG: hypothetical protein ACR2O8_13575 [Rhizobiaceae bacterium]
MLYRRFALVTLSIALMGVMLSQIIEATQPRVEGFAIQVRLNGWKHRDALQACPVNTSLCATFYFSSRII